MAEEAAAGAAPPKKAGAVTGMIKMAIYGVIVLVISVGGYIITDLFLMPLLYPSLKEKAVAGTSEEENRVGGEMGPLVEFKDILVNPAGSKGEAIFMLSVNLEADDDASQKDIEDRKTPILDAIINYYSTISVMEFYDDSLKTVINQELIDIINSKLSPGRNVRNMYYAQRFCQHQF